MKFPHIFADRVFPNMVKKKPTVITVVTPELCTSMVIRVPINRPMIGLLVSISSVFLSRFPATLRRLSDIIFMPRKRGQVPIADRIETKIDVELYYVRKIVEKGKIIFSYS